MQQILLRGNELLPSLTKMVMSAPGEKSPSLPEKILIRSGEGKYGKRLFRAEEKVGNKVFHKTLSPETLLSYLEEKQKEIAFRELHFFTEEKEIAFRISKKGKVLEQVFDGQGVSSSKDGHNRTKNYLIQEGEKIPFLVDLGIFTREYKIVSAKQDKFRQINRFLELMDHAFGDFEKEEIRVLDFGCGKSYLTFLVYYYFAVVKKMRVVITGYDLKEDVVDRCNDLAKKYGYHGLSFVVADVTKDALSEEPIDFVISLHACDVATDYAIHFALEKKVPYLFSVPCCQHEVAKQIKKGSGDLDLFLSHGLFRERMSALLTDSFRTKILEAKGYEVDVLEFVDFAHSPKNIMLRAKKKPGAGNKSLSPLLEIEKRYSFRQTLLHLCIKEDDHGTK